MKNKFCHLFALPALLTIALSSMSTAIAQGTAFTYQGRLNSGGAPASGSYDLSFTLFNTNLAGIAIAGPVTNKTVSVTNGLFTTLVDLGNAFTGTSNWLEIAVSTNGANAFTTLAPRQQVTPVPLAVFANSANNAVTAVAVSGSIAAGQLVGTIAAANIADGTITSNLLATGSVGATQLATNIGVWTQSGANIYYTNGNAGIGTNNPTARLHVSGSSTVVLLADGSSTAGTWLDLRNTAGGTNWQIISTGPANGEGAGKLLFDIGPFPGFVSGNVMTLTPNRRIGIGTVNPASPLQVVGSIIGGGPANLVASNLTASTIAGGGVPGFPNSVYGESSFIGAGNANTINSNIANSFIGAGYGNNQSSTASFIGAGNFNSIQTNSDFSVVGGGQINTIGTGAGFSAVGGGNGNTIQTSASISFIGGGQVNLIGTNAFASVVAGGSGNNVQSQSYLSFIGGGNSNVIQPNSSHQVIAGGMNNTIQSLSWASAIGGGGFNVAQGYGATVPGGWSNAATANFTFAAGQNAQAIHAGSFVWAGDSSTSFTSTANNSFNVRATGGVAFVTSGAGLNVDGQPVLTTGSLPPANVAQLNASQTFTGQNTFAGVLARGGAPGPFGFNNNGYAFIGNGGDNDSGMYSTNDGVLQFYNDNIETMRLVNGRVGIGTAAPASPLQVVGNIRMGSGGNSYAASGPENLRIVRGIVNSAGTVVTGAGFTVVKNIPTGSYTITFTPAFSDVPAVTASGVNTQVNVGGSISSSSITVQTSNLQGTAAQNGNFSFIAVGPQ